MKVLVEDKETGHQQVVECDRLRVEELDGIVMVNLYYKHGDSYRVRESFDPLVYLCTAFEGEL